MSDNKPSAVPLPEDQSKAADDALATPSGSIG